MTSSTQTGSCWHIAKTLSLWVCSYLFLFGVAHAKSKAPGGFSVQYARPMLSYVGLRLRGAQMTPFEKKDLETLVRKQVEVGRFIYVKLPLGKKGITSFVKKMVEVVTKRSMGIAKMRAEWSSQFQGFSVTEEQLHSIQNQSYIYWIEVTSFRRQRKFLRNRWERILAGGSHVWEYKLKGSIFLQKLEIFDCRTQNRKKSRLHERFCRSKKPHEYTGFAKPFLRVNAEAGGRLGERMLRHVKRRVALRKVVNKWGRSLLLSLTKNPVFTLHAPIVRSKLQKVYLPMGRKEGLKRSQGFKVFVRHVRGHLLYKGFVKVRRVGDNRMKLEGGVRTRVAPKAPLYTIAEPIIVRGGLRLKKGMMVYEYPQVLLSVGAYVGLLSLSSPKFFAQGDTKGTPPSLGIAFPFPENNMLVPSISVEVEKDISETIGWNEFHLYGGLEFVLGENASSSFGFPVGIQFGVLKKWYLRQIVLELGMRVGGAGFFSGQPRVMLGGEGVVGGAFFFTPHFSLSLRVGFRGYVPVFGTTSMLGPWLRLGGFFTF